MTKHRVQDSRVFLSYAREDQNVALRLHDDLSKNGVTAWIDVKDLLPGQDWRHSITTGIRASAYFIALLSSASVGKRGFFQKELRLAFEVLEELPPGEIFIIPVRVNECMPPHSFIERLNWVDLFPSYDKGLARILEALKSDPDPIGGPPPAAGAYTCPYCGAHVAVSSECCPDCGRDVGAPNVRSAQLEQSALDLRYRAALDRAQAYGYQDRLLAFETAMKESVVVLNMQISSLWRLLVDDRSLYEPYLQMVGDTTRSPSWETVRTVVEARLFPGYGRKLRFGLLSIDGCGLRCYGRTAVTLDESLVAHRASVLESGSFQTTNRSLLQDCFPAGFRSLLTDRHKLAVAKLGHRLGSAATREEYSQLLLTSGELAANADFMEVQIYGPFSVRAIRSILVGPAREQTSDELLTRAGKELAQTKGIKWTESQS